MAPHLGVDTAQIKDKARRELLDLLEGVRGRKNLVIEKSLADTIGVFVRFSTLQDHGVDKLFLLENKNVDTSQKNVIFLASGEKAANVIAIAEQIQRLQKASSTQHEFSIIWVPRRTLVGDKILEESGVLGELNVEVLDLHFVPLEGDLLSLCFNDAFNDIYLYKDPTSIFLAARALMGLQNTYGLFPRIIGKGDNANRLMELLFRMRKEAAAEDNAASFGPMPSAHTESLIIIDREVDLATPLLTQLTYEGLIDEMFGIEDNQAEIDTSIIGQTPSAPQQSKTNPPGQQSLKRKILLDSSDKLYDQLRDTNFAIVDSLLNKVARRLQSDMQSRHEAKSTSELREFVTKLPGYQAEQQNLKTHIALTEDILKHTQSPIFRQCLEFQQNLADGTDPSSQHETLEELIARDVPLPTILRLLCLESCISGGLRQKDLEHFKRLVMQAYGYQHLLTLSALEKIGLLQMRASASVLFNPLGATTGTAENSKTNYNYLRKVLRLFSDEVNEQNPNDISYVYSGYAPLSVRLVQAVLQKQHLLAITKGPQAASIEGAAGSTSYGWQGFESALGNVKGATFSKVQKGEEAATKARHMLQGSAAAKGKTVVVMFLGGITFTEIAALRFLAKQEEGKRNLLICTTGVISGNSIMNSVIEKEDFSKT
ncbi:uncharacterized protein KY384_008441 [Bacidia gigantensis]|uniref:uncharacterized protein n=1 Tax=Bacidia gigantensis TaxID=2732470 RepID=UPI001D0522FB|nr:uncharacterized protein KY384_008441 [Bacidia gigantensis]KAG8527012.1 hypothetical protein KY384_008441 [Bacidia gigantensis]